MGDVSRKALVDIEHEGRQPSAPRSTPTPAGDDIPELPEVLGRVDNAATLPSAAASGACAPRVPPVF